MAELEQAVVAQVGSGDIATYDLTFAVEQASKNFRLVEKFVDENFTENVDYGPPFPGSDKPTLLKPGAEKVDGLFNVRPEFEIIERTTDPQTGFFYIQYKCRLVNRSSGVEMGSGLGSCNSFESKYRWRNAERACPNCGKSTIKKSRFPPREDPHAEPGWYCYDKIGGCGANFSAKAPEIVQQTVGRVENPDLLDVWNTVDKIAQKRAHVAAALTLGFLSSRFTQDAEDFNGHDVVDAVVVKSAPKGSAAATNQTQTVAQEPAQDASVEMVIVTIGGVSLSKPADEVISPKAASLFIESFVGEDRAFDHSNHVKNHVRKHFHVDKLGEMTWKKFNALIGYALVQQGAEGHIDPKYYADKIQETVGDAPTDNIMESVEEIPYAVDRVTLMTRWQKSGLQDSWFNDLFGVRFSFLADEDAVRAEALLVSVEKEKLAPTLEALKEALEMG